MASRRQSERVKNPSLEENEAPPSGRSKNNVAPRPSSLSKRPKGEDEETQSETKAKVDAVRSRVAAARAQKASGDTQEDLPAVAPSAPKSEELVTDGRILEILGSQVKRLHVRSEESQRRLESLDKRFAGLEERLDERLEQRLQPGETRQTELEVQLSHQGQELLDQRANLEALNRRLTEQYGTLQREMHDLLTRTQAVVEAPPQAPPENREQLEALNAAHAKAATLQHERESWMERCVELEAQQYEYLETLETKDAEILALTAQLEALRDGSEETKMELLLKNEELNAITGTLKTRERQLHDIEVALKNRDEELAELSNYSEELENKRLCLEQKLKESQQNSELQGELESLQNQLAASVEILELREHRIEGLSEQLEGKTKEAEALVQEHEQIVQSLQLHLQGREKSLESLSLEMEAKDTLLGALAAQLEDNQRSLQNLRDQDATAKQLEQLRKEHVLLKADYEEIQTLHKDLRDEHMSQTTSLNEERLQLDRGLEQARMQLRGLSERYSKQVDTAERLVRQLALNDTLLDEVEVVLDALPPPPPSLAQPVRRLRQKISEIRASRQVLEGNDFQSYEDRITVLQQELVETRQKLLDSHSEIDKAERDRDRATQRLRELEEASKGRG